MSTASTPTGPTCTVTCICRKVTVTFASERPKKCVECCCCDCRSALQWCLHQNNQDKEVNKPIPLLYVDNDILKIETKRDGDTTTSSSIFELMKLRPGAGSLRVLSKCCHSMMMILHPFYLRNRVAIMPDAVGSVTYKDSTTDPVPVSLRMQTKFWNVDELGELPALPLMEQVNKETQQVESVPIPSTASDQPSWFFTTGMVPFMMYPLPTRQGFTARTLMDVYVNKGDDVFILNIPEPPIDGHYQTNKGGMLSLTFKNPFHKKQDAKGETETSEEM
jgi:hypothetical protein